METKEPAPWGVKQSSFVALGFLLAGVGMLGAAIVEMAQQAKTGDLGRRIQQGNWPDFWLVNYLAQGAIGVVLALCAWPLALGPSRRHWLAAAYLLWFAAGVSMIPRLWVLLFQHDSFQNQGVDVYWILVYGGAALGFVWWSRRFDRGPITGLWVGVVLAGRALGNIGGLAWWLQTAFLPIGRAGQDTAPIRWWGGLFMSALETAGYVMIAGGILDPILRPWGPDAEERPMRGPHKPSRPVGAANLVKVGANRSRPNRRPPRPTVRRPRRGK